MSCEAPPPRTRATSRRPRRNVHRRTRLNFCGDLRARAPTSLCLCSLANHLVMSLCLSSPRPRRGLARAGLRRRRGCARCRPRPARRRRPAPNASELCVCVSLCRVGSLTRCLYISSVCCCVAVSLVARLSFLSLCLSRCLSVSVSLCLSDAQTLCRFVALFLCLSAWGGGGAPAAR
jgi:hypothetical protein